MAIEVNKWGTVRNIPVTGPSKVNEELEKVGRQIGLLGEGIVGAHSSSTKSMGEDSVKEMEKGEGGKYFAGDSEELDLVSGELRNSQEIVDDSLSQLGEIDNVLAGIEEGLKNK